MTDNAWGANVLTSNDPVDRDELEAEIVQMTIGHPAHVEVISEPADQYPVVRFTVPGVARPQGSKRAFVTPRGKVNMVEMNPNLGQWRTDVGWYAAQAMVGHDLLEGPIMLDAVFVFVRPKSHYTTTGKLTKAAPPGPTGHLLGDLDKLVRAIEDAMTGIVFKDDSQVTTLNRPRKRWGLSAATYITVRPDPQDA